MTKRRKSDPGKPDPGMLQKRWLRDFTSEGVKYVPETMAKPSRMHEGFELREDGSAVRIGAGPTDAETEAAGTWDVDEDGVITISAEGAAPRKMRIVEIDDESLVVEEEPKG